MPEIRFFEPVQYNADRSTKDPSPPKSFMVGEHQFDLTKIEPVNELDTSHFMGQMHFIGFEAVYTNDVISQEETDRFMQQYRKETGQA